MGILPLPGGGGFDTPGQLNPICAATPAFGLGHVELGNAVVENLQGTLVVSNIGSSGQDGVAILPSGFEGFGMFFDLVNPVGAPPGAQLKLASFGVIDGVPGLQRTTIEVTKKCNGPLNQPRFEVRANFEPYDPISVRVDLIDETGDVLDSQDFPSPNPDTVLACFGPDTCEIDTDYAETVEGATQILTTLIFPNPVSATLAPSPGDCICSETFPVKRIRITASPLHRVDIGPIEWVELILKDFDMLAVYDEYVRAFDNLHHGLGDVLIDVPDPGIIVNILVDNSGPLGSSFGVKIDSEYGGYGEASTIIGLIVNTSVADDSPIGSSLELAPVFEAGPASLDLGSLKVTGLADLAILLANFTGSDAGATGITVEGFHNGVPVGPPVVYMTQLLELSLESDIYVVGPDGIYKVIVHYFAGNYIVEFVLCFTTGDVEHPGGFGPINELSISVALSGVPPEFDSYPKVMSLSLLGGDGLDQFTIVDEQPILQPTNNPADLNGDGVVDGADLGIMLGNWGPCANCAACVGDLNGDCVVDGGDLGALLSAWTA